MKFGPQFCLFMWKHWKVCMKRKYILVLRLVQPMFVYFMALLFLGLDTVEEIRYKPFKCDTKERQETLLFSPQDSETTKIMNALKGYKTEGVANHDQLEEIYQNNEISYFAGVQFDIVDGLINIIIRFPAQTMDFKWYPTKVYSDDLSDSRRGDSEDERPKYFHSGFLCLQESIARAIVIAKGVESGFPNITMHRYSIPENRIFNGNMILPVAMFLLLFFTSVMQDSQEYIEERQDQTLALMKSMGLSLFTYWLSFMMVWSFFNILSIIPPIICMYQYVFFGQMLLCTDVSIVMVFCLLIIISYNAFFLFIANIAPQGNIGLFLPALIFLIIALTFVQVANIKDPHILLLFCICLIPPYGAGVGFLYIFNLEYLERETNWNNVFSRSRVTGNCTLGGVMLFLLLDILIYSILTLYVMKLYNGDNEILRSWNFLCTKSCWNKTPYDESDEEDIPTEEADPKKFEEIPDDLSIGLETKHLRKEFNKHPAVHDLSLKIYIDQITVLLGHNGAGKSTTMSMIVGLLRPTKGTVIIDGFDMRKKKVNSSVGFCPQYNILFKYLSVSHHLQFFCKVKGISQDEIKAEIEFFLNMLELMEKKNEMVSKLSSGMKRRLSLAIAFCGKSKIVILDEPTSGVDPATARSIWEVLRKLKEGRTIVMSTRSMEEADMLGDRIAIMAHGKLECIGTGFFLKKLYGAGYYLIIVKGERCDPNKVTSFLRDYIPDLQIYSNVAVELTYLISDEYVDMFEEILEDLEENKDQLRIVSFGLSVTTLEEVFLKTGTSSGSVPQIDDQNETEIREKSGGCNLFKDQLHAMSLKMYLRYFKNWIFLLIIFSVPIVYGIIVMTDETKVYASGKRELSLNMFSKYKCLVQGENPFLLSYIAACNYNTEKMTDIEEEALGLYKEKRYLFKEEYLVGATFTNGSLGIKIWFNNFALHTPGVASSLVLTSISEKLTGTRLKYFNYPLSNINGNGIETNPNYLTQLEMPLLILFIILGFHLLQEKCSIAKHLQFVYGLKIYNFWLTTFIFHYLIFLIYLLLLLGVIFCFQKETLSTSEDFIHIWTIFILYGFTSLWLVYLVCFFFQNEMSGLLGIMLILLLLSMTGTILFTYREKISDYRFLPLVIPSFACAEALSRKIQYTGTRRNCTNVTSCTEHVSLFREMEKPGILLNIIYFLWVGIVMIIFVMLIELDVFSLCTLTTKKKESDEIKNEDVVSEATIIKSLTDSEIKAHALVLKEVVKEYDNVTAVNNVSVGVTSKECFGLLGVNGAGKTTLFKILTGEIRLSNGNVWVLGFHSIKQQSQIRKHIGYCPQFDALFMHLTPRETVTIFGLLRGLKYKSLSTLAEKLARNFDFQKHIDKKIKTLSRDNKRKISIAIAFIGDPEIILLDEPTTGMDPATKRFFWNQIIKLRNKGKLIILSSNSMEECQAVCTRLVIMVNGVFKCIGSPQELKNRYLEGYILTIKLKHIVSDNIKAKLEDLMAKSFPGCKQLEKYRNYFAYSVNTTEKPLYKMFGIMEKAKQDPELFIEDYTLGQSSLEQLFLLFARRQTN